MAARTPRRSFATPFVVTLAAAPACYVQTSPAPSGPPPSQPPPTEVVEPSPPPPPPSSQPPTSSQPPGPVVVANPPPPTTQPTRPDPRPLPPATQPRPVPPPVTTTQTPPVRPDPRPIPPATPAAQESRWTLYKAKDGCMAAIKVDCQPKATCNPPPPFKTGCPEGISLDKPVTIVSQDGASCFVQFEMPTCPPGVACNPPRPQPVACPKRQ